MQTKLQEDFRPYGSHFMSFIGTKTARYCINMTFVILLAFVILVASILLGREGSIHLNKCLWYSARDRTIHLHNR